MTVDIEALVAAAEQVVKHLRARADFSKVRFEIEGADKRSVSAADAVKDIEDFEVSTTAAVKGARQSSREGGGLPAEDAVRDQQALVQAILNSNLAMMRAGSLSTARTLEPSVATTHNEDLEVYAKQLKLLLVAALAGATEAGTRAEQNVSQEPDPAASQQADQSNQYGHGDERSELTAQTSPEPEEEFSGIAQDPPPSQAEQAAFDTVAESIVQGFEQWANSISGNGFDDDGDNDAETAELGGEK